MKRRRKSTVRPKHFGRSLEQLEARVLLAGDLVAHWRAHELRETVADGGTVERWTDLASGLDANAQGEPTLIHDGIDGRSVLRFSAQDGVDLFRVPAANSPMKGADDYSIAVTFRTDSVDLIGGETKWFDNSGLVDGSQLGFTTDWGLSINSAGQVGGGMGESLVAAPATVYSSRSGLNDGEMHTAILVRQGAELSIWVDGQDPTTRSDAGTRARSEAIDFVIGALQPGGNGFSGDIAEVRVYNDSLTSDEVQQLQTDITSYYDNEAPVAVADSFALSEDSNLFFSPVSILANDVDPDGDPLSAVLVDDVDHGTLSLNANGSFVYAPDPDYFGADSFTYTANDFRPSNVVAVSIEVTPTYDPPVPQPDHYKMLPTEILQIPAIIGLLGNDQNPDMADLSTVVAQNVDSGVLTLQTDGSFQYDPQGFAGLASFSYQIDDGSGLSAPQTVQITVNTPPSGQDDTLNATEDTALLLSQATGVVSNDQDADGDAMTASLVDEPEHGTLTFEADGALSYLPDLNYFGPDQFSYRLSDGVDDSGIVTVNVTIVAVDDSPSAADDGYFGAPGEPIVVPSATGLLANDSDVDSPDLTVRLEQAPAHGVLELSPNGAFAFTPEADFVGTDSFLYRTSDGNSSSEQAEVSLFVGDSPLRISEFMAANTGGIETRIRDDAGRSYRGERDTPDWIEIKNLSSSAVDIGGFHLTDDQDDRTKWAFPEGTQVAGNGFLIVYATQLNIIDTDLDETERLHTNFALTLNGEYLAVTAPDGTVLDEYVSQYPQQRPGVSFGIAADGTVGYLTEATPGANNSASYPGTVADTKFSADRGLYDQPIQVEIRNATAGAQIRYTFDGSAPTADQGMIYAAPITIDRTTTLRAAAFFGDYLPSNVDTQTYIFVDQVIEQSAEPTTGPTSNEVAFPTRWRAFPANYEMDPEITQSATYEGRMRAALTSLPSLSLTLHQEDIFDASGLYANPQSVNEKATSAELIYPDGTVGFQIDAGARMQGGASRNPEHVKHSMSLRFREEYGSAKLDFPLFEDSPVTTFNSIHLRARYNNSWIHWDQGQRTRGSMIREAWARDSMLDAGDISAGHGNYVHLYLNGLYWGVYEMHERQDASHFAEYFGGEAHEYDARNATTIVDGDADAYNELRGVVRDRDWEQIQQMLDVDNHIMFNIVQLYGGNQDLKADGNWRMAGGGSAGGRWHFYMWDVERILENNRQRGTSPVGDLLGYRGQLDDIEEYRVRFADHVHRLLYNDGALTPENAAARWMNRANELDLAIVAESARWGDTRQTTPFTRDEHWINEQNRLIETYFPVRTANVISDFRRTGLYPDTDAPEFLVGGERQHGGRIDDEAVISFENPNDGNVGQLLFTLDGSDPRDAGGGVSPKAVVYAGGALPIDGSTRVMARILNGDEWSALTDAAFFFEVPASTANLAITEVNYHPHSGIVAFGEPDVGGSAFEFIEVKNVGDGPINLAGVQLRQALVDGASDGVRFNFAAEILMPGEYRVVVRNQDAFAARYGQDVQIASGNDGLDGPDGVWGGGRLGDGGETISLFAADGSVIRQFKYDDEGSWPERADGVGSSLVIVDPAANAEEGRSWRASDVFGGTPGGPDQVYAQDIVVNEILTNSDAPQLDQVELLNVSDSPVDVSHWYLSDSANNVLKFQFSDDLAPLNSGEYLVLDENQLGFGFKGQQNDDVWLLAADENGPIRFADSFSFLATEAGVSLGRWPNGQGGLFPQQSITLGSKNSGPLLNGPVISELNYNPESPDGGLTSDDIEYVEVWNPTGTPLDLSQWRLGKAVEFSFAQGTSLGPNRGIVVVAFDPTDAILSAAFRTNYVVGADVDLVGPFSGVLDNGGENLELQRPVANDDSAFILVDRVRFDDDAPWPTTPDGMGDSLHRLSPNGFGDFVDSWMAKHPSPGQADFGPNPADLNEDGRVGVADIDFLSAGIRALDERFDLDQNGAVNSDDLSHFVKNILGLPLGDSNLDGLFNSSDLVKTFQAGEYEDGVAGNSTWGEGDWNGDGDFDTRDLVLAFQEGAYTPARSLRAANVAAAVIGISPNREQSIVERGQAPLGSQPLQPRPVPSDFVARDLIFSEFDGTKPPRAVADEDLLGEEI